MRYLSFYQDLQMARKRCTTIHSIVLEWERGILFLNDCGPSKTRDYQLNQMNYGNEDSGELEDGIQK